MTLNTQAIRAAIDELKARIASDTEAVVTLERLIGAVSEKPGAKPKKRGG